MTEIFIEAVKQDGEALYFVSKVLRDRDIVSTAMANTASSSAFACEESRGDKDLAC